MKRIIKRNKAFTEKVLQKFLGSTKIIRISMADWGSKFQTILNSLLNTLLFALKDVFLSTLHLPKNLLSGKMQLRLVGLQKLHREFAYLGKSERGDVPGWVLVVLMTTGLVTGIWTVAQPRLSSILKNSLDNMNSIR